MTANELRAICPTCNEERPVALRGKTWRIVAHTREVLTWRRTVTRPCPVRGVDARVHIQRWFSSMVDKAERLGNVAVTRREAAAQAMAEAERLEEQAGVARAQIAALRAVFEQGDPGEASEVGT